MCPICWRPVLSSTAKRRSRPIPGARGPSCVTRRRTERFREAEHIVSLPQQASSGVTQFAELQAQRDALDAERRALEQLLSSTAYSVAGSTQPIPIAFPTLLRNQVAASLLSSLAQTED